MLPHEAVSLHPGTPRGRPPILPVDPAGIPRELTAPDAVDWVVWKLEPKKGKPGEWTKEPYRAADPTRHASSTDASTWSTFGEAFSAYQLDPSISGLGRVLHGDGIAGIDLDNALDDDGHAKPWAAAIVTRLAGAHWERSPLGRGLRGIFRAELPPGRRKVKYRDGVVEMYDDARYLTMTGVPVLEDPGETFPVETLPNLQAEAEAVHAEILGGESIEAAAVVTELSGRAEDVTPDALRVLEEVLGGRFAAQMAKVWGGDYDDFDGDESAGEWALAKESVYHAKRLGYTGDALALIVEQLMRAGPYRPKWDSPRTVTLADKRTVRTTWLGMTIGRAIKARERTAPELVVDDAAAPDDPAETAQQTIARLKRELAQERAAGAVRQTVIRTLRAENEELRARFQEFKRVVANPNLSGNEAKVALVLTMESHSPTQPLGGEPAEWARICLKGAPEDGWIGMQEKTGLSVNTISETVKRLSRGPGAPFESKHVSSIKERQDGTTGPVTALYVRPRAERASETLRVLAEFKPDKPQHGGSEAAIVAREEARRCRRHPFAEVVESTVWRCSVSTCRAIVGEEPRDHKVCDDGDAPATVVESRTLDPSVCDEAGPNGAGAYSGPDHQLGDRAAANGNGNGHARAPAAVLSLPVPAWRCGRCGAFERRQRGDGSWHCLGCGGEAER